MRGLASLATRLAKVEARRKYRPVELRFIDTLYPDQAGEPVGVVGEDGRMIPARAGEDIAALCDRAAAELEPCRFLSVAYAEIPAAEGSPAPEPAPALSSPAQDDPWALAGIGRRATRSELERMGAAWLPPERLS